MAARLFSLIIGIDTYKSGRIWNLHSSVEDAKRIKRFFMDILNVPRDQIRILLDSQATKKAIEDNFMEHLTNNPAIERGDAIVIYFAGHGSTVSAPPGWFQGTNIHGKVEVLCPYDHDTKQTEGRVAGISDRSLHALIRDLSQAKGDNITFIADCCFSPLLSRDSALGRSHTRWTPTIKAKADDLYSGLWLGARGRAEVKGLGFYGPDISTHTFLSACGPGGKAIEGKDGGRFTSTFLQAASELALHRTSYLLLSDYLCRKLASESQQPVCRGQHKDRTIFNTIPFTVDARYIPVCQDNDMRLRIEVGTVQGIVEGSELSLHLHNYRGSRNPQISVVTVVEVHPTWSIGKSKTPNQLVPKRSWARITRWNNRRPFRIHLKATFVALCRRWRLRRDFSEKSAGSLSKAGLNIIRVKNIAQADISLRLGFRDTAVEIQDNDPTAGRRRIVKIERRDALDIIDDAARFYMHLHRINPEYPLKDLVRMELFRLNPSSWSRVGGDLLRDGTANIADERGAIFTVLIHNNSDLDLWPYLFYMDPNCYGITILYHPQSVEEAPLPKRGSLEIGSGQPGSEALSFALSDHKCLDSGYLKLFLVPRPIVVGMIEQGPPFQTPFSCFEEHSSSSPTCGISDSIWDSISACIQYLRRPT